MATPRELTNAITTAYNAHELSKVVQFFKPDIVLMTPDAGALFPLPASASPSEVSTSCRMQAVQSPGIMCTSTRCSV